MMTGVSLPMLGVIQERSADWYIAVLNAISDLILVKGDRSKLLWANQAFLDYYGMSNEQLQDIVDAPHSDPYDTVQYVKDDHQVFSTGETHDIPSEPCTDSHGNVEYFHTVKDAITDASGAVERTVGVSRRIVDQDRLDLSKYTHSERKSSLGALRTLVQHIPLAVAMFDVKQRSLCHSEAWRELTESTGTELVGEFYDTRFEAFIPLRGALSATVDSGQAQRVDAMSILTPSRRSIVADIEIRPWFLSTGEVGGSVVLVHDITRMKASERALQQVNEELSQFNYRVSHDLLAPLRTARGYLNICRDEFSRNPQKVHRLHDKMTRAMVVSNRHDTVFRITLPDKEIRQ